MVVEIEVKCSLSPLNKCFVVKDHETGVSVVPVDLIRFLTDVVDRNKEKDIKFILSVKKYGKV